MSPDELEEMRATVAAFLADRASSRRVREVMVSSDGFDASLWTGLAGDLGLAGVLVPEAHGGLGLDFADAAVLLAETARRPVSAPVAELLAATATLAACDTPEADGLLAEIAASSPVIAIGGCDPAAPRPAARLEGDRWMLSGGDQRIPFAHVADLVLLVAETPAGPAVFAVRPSVQGATVRAHPSLDMTRWFGDLSLDHAAATMVSAPSGGARSSTLLGDLMLIAQAVEAAAGAASVLELTLGYLTVREQFGTVIGSFQALKHRCADHAVAVAGARSTARHAALAAAAVLGGAAGDEPLDVMAALSKSVCADVYLTVAADAIQLHGGIGFTFEHDVHLYFKRAKVSQHCFGHPTMLRRRLAVAAGIGAPSAEPASG